MRMVKKLRDLQHCTLLGKSTHYLRVCYCGFFVRWRFVLGSDPSCTSTYTPPAPVVESETDHSITLTWGDAIEADRKSGSFPPFKTGTFFVLYRTEIDPQDGSRCKGTTVEQSCGGVTRITDCNLMQPDKVYGYSLVCVDPNRSFSLPSPITYVRTDPFVYV